MIDLGMKQLIIREASASYEQIATDFNAYGESYPEDAVEPTVWNMQANLNGGRGRPPSSPEYSQLEKMVVASDHPDRKEFLSIVEEAVKRYF